MRSPYLFILSALVATLGIGRATGTFADTATVTNTVSVSASSGGNSVAAGGTVNQGTASVNVHVDQTVNGFHEPPIDIATTSPSASAEVRVRSEVRAVGDRASPVSSTSVERTNTTHSTENGPPAGTVVPKAVDLIPPSVPGKPTITNALLSPAPVAVIEKTPSRGMEFIGTISNFFTTIFNWFFRQK